MTCAIRPQPMTPTRSRLAIPTLASECFGTFHGTYRKRFAVSTGAEGGRKSRRSLRDSLFGRYERVLVLDRQGLDAATGDQLADEGVPPGLVLAPPDDREVPWHRLGRPRPAPVEEAVDGEVVSGE